MEGKTPSGKGDSYRKIDGNKYRENWDRIFGNKPVKKLKIVKGPDLKRAKEIADRCVGDTLDNNGNNQ